jgi:integrase/recombinase XerD
LIWEYWHCLYIDTHCVARGLSPRTIKAYSDTIKQFRNYIEDHHGGLVPGEVKASHVLEYVLWLRNHRSNGNAAVNRQVTVLKGFYRAMVAMGHLAYIQNPMNGFPKMKASPRKLPVVLTYEEVDRLIEAPTTDTILGLRDRAMLALLYGGGIRASECSGLVEIDVDLEERTIRVTGKGGHQRVVPLNVTVVEAMRAYRDARGTAKPTSTFFLTRSRRAMSRGAVFERVRRHARVARIPKRVSPHTLRHTCATHLVREAKTIVEVRDFLGHRQITSTQIYLHVSGADLREAADRHPIQRLASKIGRLLPDVRLPWQPAPLRRQSG